MKVWDEIVSVHKNPYVTSRDIWISTIHQTSWKWNCRVYWGITYVLPRRLLEFVTPGGYDVYPTQRRFRREMQDVSTITKRGQQKWNGPDVWTLLAITLHGTSDQLTVLLCLALETLCCKLFNQLIIDISPCCKQCHVHLSASFLTQYVQTNQP